MSNRCRGAAIVAALGAAGCGTGSVEVVLDLPQKAELAPAGEATITLIAERAGESPRSTTSIVRDDGSFDVGKLPVVDGLSLSVVLRSPTQRVVGYGRATALVDVAPRDTIEVHVPMRRPFAYMTGSTQGLAAQDTTLDQSAQTANKYQQMVQANGAALVAAAGGDVWAIAASGHAQRILGATHTSDGATLELPGGARDAVASSDGRWVIAGVPNGMAIADTTNGKVTTVSVSGGVDRVAIGLSPQGGLRAIGLSGRRTDGACGSTSMIALVDLGDTLGTLATADAHAPLADVAASESIPDLVGVDPCAGALLRLALGGDGSSLKLASVPSPTAAAMFGAQAWALGTAPGHVDPGIDPTTQDDVTDKAANLVLVSAAIDGSSSNRADLSPVRQNVQGFDEGGNTIALARDINADTATPIDLVAVPPGDQVALIYTATYHAPALSDGLHTVIPETSAQTSEYELLNATGGAVVQRILTDCKLDYKGGDVSSWQCEPATGADWSIAGRFTPGNLAVLFGGR